MVNRYVLSEIKGAISNLLVTPAGYVYLSVAGQGTYEYDLAERRLQKINTEMNDAMVTHAFIDQYDKIWFHENEKALIYYDPLNHTAKRSADDFCNRLIFSILFHHQLSPFP